MYKYKAKFKLMVDPQKGDETVSRTYYVEAENEHEALRKAEKAQDNDELEFRYLSVFEHKIKKI